jgi:hypothetical protein
MRQSLYAKPKNGAINFVTVNDGRAWGYYADGYFDRRAIVNSVSNAVSSAVSASTKDVAYIGTLFFNAASGASLFMPAGGRRYTSDGDLDYSGYYGSYWSSSSYLATGNPNVSMGLDLVFQYDYIAQSGAGCSYGMPVRCVKE